MLYIKQNSSYVVHFIRKIEVIQTEVLIYQSVHMSVFTFFTWDRVFCANGIVMNKWQFSLESCDVLLYHFPSSYLPVLSYMGQFYIVYLNNFFVKFKTDLAFIIDVIQPQSMYSKLLGHCGCYSFICNVAQKIPAEPTAWFYQLFIYLTIYQSVLFLGKKFTNLPRFAADVVIINHKYLDSDVEYEMSYYILFST